jgi:hypothetical protein
MWESSTDNNVICLATQAFWDLAARYWLSARQILLNVALIGIVKEVIGE